MLSVQTPAKINLFLNIRPRRADGYHDISSVMQAITLFDRLDIRPLGMFPGDRPDNRRDIEFSCNIPAFEKAAADNLVVKAYHLFWKETALPPLGLKVRLEKGIPVQAGLGGGSSDAAAMLLILNHLACAGLSEDSLRRIGARLGSDVPFFITGGIALAEGRGEIVQPLPESLIPELSLVVIKPRKLNIDTSLAYHRFANDGTYDVKSPEHLLRTLHAVGQKRRFPDAAELDSYFLNDFEKVLFSEYPLLAQMAQRMRDAGIHRPLLSGSGSAMVGFTEATKASRKTIGELFPQEQFEIFWARTHADGLRQISDTALHQPVNLSVQPHPNPSP